MEAIGLELLTFELGDAAAVGRLREERDVQPLGIGLVRHERIAGDDALQLRLRAQDDVGVDPEAGMDLLLDSPNELGTCDRASKDDVAALHVRLHVLGADVRHQRPEPRHRDLVARTEVDPAEHHDVAWHPLGAEVTLEERQDARVGVRAVLRLRQ